MTLRLSLACSECDRTQGLRDGSVPVEGVSLTCIGLPVEEIFHRMVRFAEFDAAELSLSSYVLSLQMGNPFIAVPAFPSRMFRHSGIYVNSRCGIREPADLIGRTVGVAEYQLTANVWIRGILQEHYGVPAASVTYRTGGLHAPGRVEKLPLSLPGDIRVEPIGERQTLAQMLVAGEIDALYTPRTPAPYAQGRPEVRRLFADAAAEEARYFAATGVFPIMHTVVLRRARYDEHRWLARAFLKAFERARASGARRHRRDRHPQVHGAVAARGGGQDPPPARRGLLALRRAAEPARPGDLPQVLLRAGARPEPAAPRRPVRRGDARGFRDLIYAKPSTSA